MHAHSLLRFLFLDPAKGQIIVKMMIYLFFIVAVQSDIGLFMRTFRFHCDVCFTRACITMFLDIIFQIKSNVDGAIKKERRTINAHRIKISQNKYPSKSHSSCGCKS
jgi:hypothetical protein